jgi:DNA-binding CsgD family transcriptional regulator/tetratricopeptide (TPR) repeat protein
MRREKKREASPYLSPGIPISGPYEVPISDNRPVMNLLERQEQLQLLNHCLREARGSCGKVVLMAGEAGMGKSALVEQFVAEHRRDAFTLWGACDALDTPRALGPLHEMAGLSHGTAASEASRDSLFRTLFDEFSRPERSCVAVLEDLHWADEATLDFLRFIGRRIQRTGALLIVTYREEELPLTHPVRLAIGDLTGQHIIRMRLAPLTINAVADLAQNTRWNAATLLQVTGGNPFFLREALAASVDEVPGTVRDAVLSRLMRASTKVSELAELLAISPGRTANWLIEAIIGTPADAIQEGVTRGLFQIHADALAFRHELARMAVYSSLPPARARSLHVRLLQLFAERGTDLNEIVHHATLANDPAALLRYAPQAARQAARLGAHREAATHFKAALRHGAALPGATQAALLEEYAAECSCMNQAELAISAYQQALELWQAAGDAQAQSRVLSFLVNEHRTTGDKLRADDCIHRAITLLELLPHNANLAFAYHARARIASNRGLDQEAVEYGKRALALAREFGNRETESNALNTIGSALLIAGDRSGYTPLEQSLQLALQYELQEGAARAYCNLVFCCVLEHDFERAERFLAEGVAFCEERVLFASVTYLQCYGARLALERGEWSKAEQITEELARSTGLQALQRVPTLTTLGLLRARRGAAGAQQALAQALEIALPMGEPERVGRAYAARAELAFYRGDTRGMGREAASGLEHLRGLKFPWLSGELFWWLSQAQRLTGIPDGIATPFRLMIGGDWQAGAQHWAGLGMPYEQALALMAGPEGAVRQALVIFDKLGAVPLATIARRQLRASGVRNVPRGPNETTRSNPAGLTSREIEILALLAHGSSNAQLARRLHRSQKTIDHHISAILEKLGVHSRTEALAAAIALGVVTTGTSAPAVH